jgi:putative DNA-invertase from lambdoid prophage Rac
MRDRARKRVFPENLTVCNYCGLLAHSLSPGAMAEFERSLIQERVKAGLRNARAKGKRLGRPRAIVDSDRVMQLRTEGLPWRAISAQVHVGLGTVVRAAGKRSKIPCEANG